MQNQISMVPPVIVEMDETGKLSLPYKKRICHGSPDIVDESQPQIGDQIVTYFAKRWHTGTVREAYIDTKGVNTYSVDYGGCSIRKDTFNGVKWRFSSTSPKYVKPAARRVKKEVAEDDRRVTGRERKQTDLYVAGPASGKGKKRVLEFDDDEVITVECESDDDEEVIVLEASAVTVVV